jgi:hypothetical protein
VDFGVLIEVIGGTGAVVAIGNEELMAFANQNDRDERNTFYDLEEFGADILVGFGQKLGFGSAEDILGFELLYVRPAFGELGYCSGNILGIKDEREILFSSGNILFRSGGIPFYFLHDFSENIRNDYGFYPVA